MDLATWPSAPTKAAQSVCPAHSAALLASNQRTHTHIIRSQWFINLESSFGLVPYTAIASNEWQHDYAGPMARTVADASLLLQVIAGADGLDDRAGVGCPLPANVPPYSELLVSPTAVPGKPLEGKVIGILKEAFEMPVLDPRVASKIKDAAQLFVELGATVEEVSIPLHAIAPTIWMVSVGLSVRSILDSRGSCIC